MRKLPVSMIALSQWLKALTGLALLVAGLVLLWEVPSWEQRQIHNERIPSTTDLGLSDIDSRTFLRHIKTRLPLYRQEFQAAAEKHKIPWTLLAAQGYQESRWNRNAMSPTGVRGLMMLTRDTAADLGITNRLDPKNSIHGGARYLAKLYRGVPRDIRESDRMAFALAAYNVGMGHVKDARILATRQGKNPNTWDDLETVLPLLAKKAFYRTLPNRYARGWEPVQYVKRIRVYRTILDRVEEQRRRTDEQL